MAYPSIVAGRTNKQHVLVRESFIQESPGTLNNNRYGVALQRHKVKGCYSVGWYFFGSSVYDKTSFATRGLNRHVWPIIQAAIPPMTESNFDSRIGKFTSSIMANQVIGLLRLDDAERIFAAIETELVIPGQVIYEHFGFTFNDEIFIGPSSPTQIAEMIKQGNPLEIPR